MLLGVDVSSRPLLTRAITMFHERRSLSVQFWTKGVLALRRSTFGGASAVNASGVGDRHARHLCDARPLHFRDRGHKVRLLGDVLRQ